MQSVGLIGATGFLGRAVAVALAACGWRVTGLSRRSPAAVAGVHEWQDWAQADFSGMRALVNLAGERIDRRWTPANQRRFHASRVGVTGRVVAAIAALPANMRPRVLVNASAVGVYGERGEELLDESAVPGSGYLAGLCRDWEAAAMTGETHGLRVVCVRIGVVLGRHGAAFRRMRTLFSLGLGGRLGSGLQWWPWIHIDDLAAALVRCVSDENIRGPVNAVAPGVVTNGEFTRTFAGIVGRRARLPVPGFMLRAALGGFGGVLLASQRAVPRVLLENGFPFRHPYLEDALQDLVR